MIDGMVLVWLGVAFMAGCWVVGGAIRDLAAAVRQHGDRRH